MTPRDFAKLCKVEKESLLNTYFDGTETAVGKLISQMALTPTQASLMRRVADSILTDAIYGLLLGLDGAASIGNVQQTYSLLDERGVLLTGGELEPEAWQAFHDSA